MLNLKMTCFLPQEIQFKRAVGIKFVYKFLELNISCATIAVFK